MAQAQTDDLIAGINTGGFSTTAEKSPAKVTDASSYDAVPMGEKYLELYL